MRLRIGKREARENMAWHGGGRRRADARQGRQRSPRRILTAELYRFLEAVPIGAGTYLDGKFFVWLRQKLLKSVRIPAGFFLARQKIFLANLHTATYWYSF